MNFLFRFFFIVFVSSGTLLFTSLFEEINEFETNFKNRQNIQLIRKNEASESSLFWLLEYEWIRNNRIQRPEIQDLSRRTSIEAWLRKESKSLSKDYLDQASLAFRLADENALLTEIKTLFENLSKKSLEFSNGIPWVDFSLSDFLTQIFSKSKTQISGIFFLVSLFFIFLFNELRFRNLNRIFERKSKDLSKKISISNYEKEIFSALNSFKILSEQFDLLISGKMKEDPYAIKENLIQLEMELKHLSSGVENDVA